MAESKKKIGTVISHCNECVFMRKYNRDGSNAGHVVVCHPTKKIVSGCDINYQIKDKIQIPDWCPLDDYKAENKTYDVLNQE